MAYREDHMIQFAALKLLVYLTEPLQREVTIAEVLRVEGVLKRLQACPGCPERFQERLECSNVRGLPRRPDDPVLGAQARVQAHDVP